ncbi:phosphoadenosine phosphosulfate reductase [Psychromarinibacter sp. C21-152]|uniref:Phosphoadenosine phosphosulfate reductase n=1 Tax=Psychromarinibacter sediminicola TaxID=3033385 RepID=A0AAE3NPC8_9RHOB|nr:phosphoadenosine phosphosulfate reductase [Psychromarinibacter sediminicola]MDF0599651.1 phosphoadenosine phosphosulfate reductase [Psychromarinibacter sediminicola]
MTRPAASAQEVLDALRAETGADGFQHLLDDDHSVSYIARGPKLLVTFERIQDTLEIAEHGLPLGLDFAEDKNWSVLHFAASGDTWFRSAAVYAVLDDMVDDAFFEEFDAVTFYGAGMGGYAAAAFSVVAPGATVVAISPQATLDPEVAEWDGRFPASRMLDFRDRYGYAPDMAEGAARMHVVYDPCETLDAVHASLFRGDNVAHLRCRHFRHHIARSLREMDVLHRLIEEAAEGRLTRAGFYALMRRRREHSRFLRNLLFDLDDLDRPYLTALYCAHVLSRMNAPAFRRRLNAARARLKDAGALPAWLPEA